MITSFSSFIPDGLSAFKKTQKLGNTFTGWNAYSSNLEGVHCRACTVVRALASQFTVFNVAQVKNPDPAVLSLLVLVLALELSLQILKFGES